ncbi:MAG: TnpA family transposase [Glaciecola sp.]
MPDIPPFTDHITSVLSQERTRIKDVLNKSLPPSTRATLLKLLELDDTFTDLAKLKKMSKDFSVNQIKKELKTHRKIKAIYSELKVVVNQLELSPKNLEYYASLVRHKSSFRLRRHADEQSILYLVCYLFFRYRETNDNLVSAFSYLVRKLSESSKSYGKHKVADDLEIVRNNLKVAGNLLSFFIESEISDDMAFGDIRKKAFKLLSKDKIRLLSSHLDNNDFDTRQYEWEYIDRQTSKVKTILRSIFLGIDLEFTHVKAELREQYLTTRTELMDDSAIKTVNTQIITKSERKYFDDISRIKKATRFEYLLYQKAEQLFQSNTLTVIESEKNRSLATDLIPHNEWEESKPQVIEKSGLNKIAEPITDILQTRQDQLSKKMAAVGQNIFNGDNKFVEFLPGKNELKWSIPNRRWRQSIDNPIYSQIQHMGIVELMTFVNQKTGYLDAFSHISAGKDSSSISNDDLIACILANGTNYGLFKMANISDRSVGKLRGVEESYIRFDTLKGANDHISNAIASLPIFSHFHIDDNQLFSSIDGQKFECRINTFKARYSSKYFFKGKGVSALTLVSNHVPVNTQIIGANEYEGHFAFDLLYNNSSDIQPNVLSTDNHGTNNVNFAILDLFGYRFAPRYAKVKRIFFDLFEVTEENGGSICLKNEINHALIIDEWDAIQHIICSLSRKTATQSTVIRKLSNGKSRTLKALHEYDRLIKSLYVLDYIDNATLRHYVQQALNRGEAYHQLRRAIASVNGNRFRGGNDYQVSQWNDCARLIANCVIYYNSALLSAYLQINEENGRHDIAEYISQLSPVAWQHINLNGEYSFNQEKAEIDLVGLLNGIKPFNNDRPNAA